MADNFNAYLVANTLRAEAAPEMQDHTLRGPLLDTYASLNSTQLKAVATELERTNQGFSGMPIADVTRENGEVKSVSFRPGILSPAERASTLTLTSSADRVDFTKDGPDRTTMIGKVVHDHSGSAAQLLSDKLDEANNREHQKVETGLVRTIESGVGAAVGRYASIGEAAPKGNLLKGLAIGGGISAAEIVIADSFQDKHPAVASFLKPTAAESVLIGAAAAIGTGSLRARAGLIAGAWVLGKADKAGEIVHHYWTSK